MSQMEDLIRQFGDAVKGVEGRQSAQLADLQSSIRVSGVDARRKALTQLAIIEKALTQAAKAVEQIKTIMEDAAEAEASFLDDIEAMRPTPGTPRIEQQKETDDG